MNNTNTIINYFSEFNNYIETEMSPEIRILLTIPLNIVLVDLFLCVFLGQKARWFQLHTVANMVVTYNILPGIIDFFRDPLGGYKLLDTHTDGYIVILLHVYHVLAFKNLTFYDYFHHILFIGFGVLPVIFLIKTNQINLAYIACCGIPGIIEYGSLTLAKNNLITVLTQKRLNAYLYTFIRLPLCMYGATLNYVAYTQDLIADNPVYTLYLNFLLFFNGAFFTLLTVDSYTKYKCLKQK